MERFRPVGGDVGRTLLGPLDRPGKEGEVGETSRPFDFGLVGGGDMETVEGRS